MFKLYELDSSIIFIDQNWNQIQKALLGTEILEGLEHGYCGANTVNSVFARSYEPWKMQFVFLI